MANLNNSDILVWEGNNKGKLKSFICKSYGFKEIKDETYPNTFSHTSKKIIFSANNEYCFSRYFLKEIPNYVLKNKNIDLNIYFQNYLKAKKLPVPIVRSTVVGKQYIDMEGVFFTLSDYIEGDYFNGSEKDIEEAILALAEIHCHSKAIKNRYHNLQKVHPNDISAFFVSELGKKLSLKDGSIDYKNIIDKLKIKLAVIENKIKKENLPFIISHGDYSPFNLVFERNSRKIVAINDFDNVDYLLGVHDLAEAFLTFSFICYQGVSSSYADYLPPKIDTDKANLILDTYLTNNNISLAEKNILADVIFVVFIELLFLGLVRGDYSLDKLEYIDKFDDDIHYFINKYFV